MGVHNYNNLQKDINDKALKQTYELYHDKVDIDQKQKTDNRVMISNKMVQVIKHKIMRNQSMDYQKKTDYEQFYLNG